MVKKKKRMVRKAKKVVSKTKAKVKAKAKEKRLGMVDHFFDKISVAAIKVKAPIKLGDVIHIKGHTTDFTQTVSSMQIEHQSMAKAKKGDDIGINVKERVREHDVIYLAAKEKVAPAPMPVSEKPDPYAKTKFLSF